MPSVSADLRTQLSRVRLLAMDVDGVLTDGGVYVLDDGKELRRFNIKDGLGLKQVMAQGIVVAWISSGTSEAVKHRAGRLGISEAHIGVEDKIALLRQLCLVRGIPLQQVAYIGDDLADAEPMRAVGLALAPADATDEIRRLAGYVTLADGGQGAVREICDLLLACLAAVDHE